MPRRPRNTPGGMVYHVLNRAVARLALFEKDENYTAFDACWPKRWTNIPHGC